jgi:hypothetical protein
MSFTYSPVMLEIHVVREDDSVEMIDLLHGGDGVYLRDWTPAENEDKGGGVFEDSPMHEGSTLIHSVIGNADEGFEFVITGSNSAACWKSYNRIKLAIEQAKAHSKQHRNAKPVYLAVQVQGQSAQYASIITGLARAVGSPFRARSPFSQVESALPMSMTISREAYRESPPGQSTAYARGITNTFDSKVFGDATLAGVTDHSSTRQIFMTNKRHLGNVNRIYAYDDSGGTYTALGASLPYTFSMNELQDAIYFGIENLTNFGPFDSLIFDIGTPASATTSYNLAYEYWDGAAWTALNIVDNTNLLSNTGVCGLFFDRESDWTSASLSAIAAGGPAVTGYWMRIRVDALTGTLTAPTQQNRRVYTASQPFVEVSATQVGEDAGLPLLIRQRFYKNNVGLEPYTESNVICGLRSGDDDNFSAYINLSDRSNPTGVTISAGTHSALQTTIKAPSGRSILYTPTGALDTWATRANIVIDDSIATYYAGKYHAYLRCGPSATGTAWSFRINIKGPSTGNTLYTTQVVTTTESSAFIPVDLGSLNLQAFTFDGSASDITLELQIKVDDNSNTLTLYDLIIIPSNEWIGSFQTIDEAVTAYLEFDSVTDPRKKSVIAYGREESDDHILFPINSSANGRMILQPGKRNRLWYFFFDSSNDNANPVLNFDVTVSGVRRWGGIRDE